ncbi:MAG: DUF1501 domain-containing protein [Opitutaceae bacterium]
MHSPLSPDGRWQACTPQTPVSPSPGLTRRDLLRRGLLCTTGALLANNLSLRALAAASVPTAASAGPAPAPRARSVIQIWLWGGACHLDTFDPKPGIGSEFTGPLSGAIETNVSGMRIGELFPLLAKQAHRYSLIRSLTHGNNGHETAAYMVQTGRSSADRSVFPSMGAVVSLFKGYDAGYQGLVPPYLVLTELQGRFSEAGFLGARYKPFATGGDPARDPFGVEGVVAAGLTEARQRDRRELLHRLNTLAHALPTDPVLTASARAESQAYDLILGDAGKVFDATQEPAALRDRYGRTTFGQSCLMARRLVERGVPFVTINYKGWDTHKRHFETMRTKLPEMDRGLSTLLQDLSDRGLLDSTIVWCGGEFGRTPRVLWEAPWNGGRGHHGRVFSALLAGGGFKGGQVVGASDAHGEDVAERPVQPADLIGSVYSLLGIDENARLPHPEGLDVRAYPPPLNGKTSQGLLREIMG